MTFCLAALGPAAASALPDSGPIPQRPAATGADDLRVPTLADELAKPEALSPLKLMADAGPSIAAGNPVIAPLKWAGEWIRPNPDKEGGYFSCTAQFITNRVILLAAHCIRNHFTGEFYPTPDDKSGFLLQYQNNSFSKAYHAVCRATWSGWVVPIQKGENPDDTSTMTDERRKEFAEAVNKSWQWDYGFVLLDADSITGHYNYSINTHWDGAVTTGYPGKLMGGEVIQMLRGDVFSEADLSYSLGDEGNEQVLWHGNPDHTQGSSGGAWVVHVDSHVSPDTNLIIGLNSYGVDNKLGANFGPFLTDDFEKLLKFAQNGCK